MSKHNKYICQTHDSEATTELPICISLGGHYYFTDIHETKEIHRMIGEFLESMARQRITNAQDTVDQIRSDNALRSDFV